MPPEDKWLLVHLLNNMTQSCAFFYILPNNRTKPFVGRLQRKPTL